MCKQYNESIQKFNEYVETFKNCKLNGEPVGYDIDFIWKLVTYIVIIYIKNLFKFYAY